MVNFIVTFLTIVEVFVALLLIGIILLQQSKAGGGLGAVGGGMTEMMLGASAGNILTKITVILASVFLGITLLLNVITGHRGPGKSVIEGMTEEVTAAPTTEQTPPTPAASPTTVPETPDPAAAPTAGAEPAPKSDAAAAAAPEKAVPAAPKPPPAAE